MKTKNEFSIMNLLIVGALIIVFFSGCVHTEDIESCLTGHTYGFWGGLWHGIIAPIDFIAMLFGKDVTLYAQNNNGAWYAFGFLLGSGGWGFMGGKSITFGRSRN